MPALTIKGSDLANYIRAYQNLSPFQLAILSVIINGVELCRQSQAEKIKINYQEISNRTRLASEINSKLKELQGLMQNFADFDSEKVLKVLEEISEANQNLEPELQEGLNATMLQIWQGVKPQIVNVLLNSKDIVDEELVNLLSVLYKFSEACGAPVSIQSIFHTTRSARCFATKYNLLHELCQICLAPSAGSIDLLGLEDRLNISSNPELYSEIFTLEFIDQLKALLPGETINEIISQITEVINKHKTRDLADGRPYLPDADSLVLLLQAFEKSLIGKVDRNIEWALEKTLDSKPPFSLSDLRLGLILGNEQQQEKAIKAWITKFSELLRGSNSSEENVDESILLYMSVLDGLEVSNPIFSKAIDSFNRSRSRQTSKNDISDSPIVSAIKILIEKGYYDRAHFLSRLFKIKVKPVVSLPYTSNRKKDKASSLGNVYVNVSESLSSIIEEINVFERITKKLEADDVINKSIDSLNALFRDDFTTLLKIFTKKQLIESEEAEAIKQDLINMASTHLVPATLISNLEAVIEKFGTNELLDLTLFNRLKDLLEQESFSPSEIERTRLALFQYLSQLPEILGYGPYNFHGKLSEIYEAIQSIRKQLEEKLNTAYSKRAHFEGSDFQFPPEDYLRYLFQLEQNLAEMLELTVDTDTLDTAISEVLAIGRIDSNWLFRNKAHTNADIAFKIRQLKMQIQFIKIYGTEEQKAALFDQARAITFLYLRRGADHWEDPTEKLLSREHDQYFNYRIAEVFAELILKETDFQRLCTGRHRKNPTLSNFSFNVGTRGRQHDAFKLVYARMSIEDRFNAKVWVALQSVLSFSESEIQKIAAVEIIKNFQSYKVDGILNISTLLENHDCLTDEMSLFLAEHAALLESQKRELSADEAGTSKNYLAQEALIIFNLTKLQESQDPIERIKALNEIIFNFRILKFWHSQNSTQYSEGFCAELQKVFLHWIEVYPETDLIDLFTALETTKFMHECQEIDSMGEVSAQVNAIIKSIRLINVDIATAYDRVIDSSLPYSERQGTDVHNISDEGITFMPCKALLESITKRMNVDDSCPEVVFEDVFQKLILLMNDESETLNNFEVYENFSQAKEYYLALEMFRDFVSVFKSGQMEANLDEQVLATLQDKQNNLETTIDIEAFNNFIRKDLSELIEQLRSKLNSRNNEVRDIHATFEIFETKISPILEALGTQEQVNSYILLKMKHNFKELCATLRGNLPLDTERLKQAFASLKPYQNNSAPVIKRDFSEQLNKLLDFYQK